MWQTCLDIPKIVMVLSADSVNASTYKPKQLGLVLYCHFSCGVFFYISQSSFNCFKMNTQEQIRNFRPAGKPTILIQEHLMFLVSALGPVSTVLFFTTINSEIVARLV